MTKKEATLQVQNLSKIIPFLTENVEVIFDLIELTAKHKKLFDGYEGNALERAKAYMLEKITMDKNPAIGMFGGEGKENVEKENNFGNL